MALFSNLHPHDQRMRERLFEVYRTPAVLSGTISRQAIYLCHRRAFPLYEGDGWTLESRALMRMDQHAAEMETPIPILPKTLPRHQFFLWFATLYCTLMSPTLWGKSRENRILRRIGELIEPQEAGKDNSDSGNDDDDDNDDRGDWNSDGWANSDGDSNGDDTDNNDRDENDGNNNNNRDGNHNNGRDGHNRDNRNDKEEEDEPSFLESTDAETSDEPSDQEDSDIDSAFFPRFPENYSALHHPGSRFIGVPRDDIEE